MEDDTAADLWTWMLQLRDAGFRLAAARTTVTHFDAADPHGTFPIREHVMFYRRTDADEDRVVVLQETTHGTAGDPRIESFTWIAGVPMEGDQRIDIDDPLLQKKEAPAGT